MAFGRPGESTTIGPERLVRRNPIQPSTINRLTLARCTRLGAAGFRILNDVVINQVLVSFGSAEKTLAVVKSLQEEGTCWCGSTVWQGHTAMRISVSSWATTEADVDGSLAAMIAAAKLPT